MDTWAGRRARAALRQAVQRYVTHGWDVVPGAYLLSAPGRAGAGPASGPAVCSCRSPRCPAPGAHPVHSDWRGRACRDADLVDWWWSAEPYGVLLPTGSTFDVFDAPPRVGAHALRLLVSGGSPVGPVARTPDRRWLFFAAPSGTSFPDLVRDHDVRHRGSGDFVLAPPTRLHGTRAVEWVRAPSDQNRRLSEAPALARLLREAAGLARSGMTVHSGPRDLRRYLRPALRLRVTPLRQV